MESPTKERRETDTNAAEYGESLLKLIKMACLQHSAVLSPSLMGEACVFTKQPSLFPLTPSAWEKDTFLFWGVPCSLAYLFLGSCTAQGQGRGCTPPISPRGWSH